MFFKPVECNSAIFYGIFVSIGEVKSAMKRKKYAGDIYPFISSYGLDYMPVGDENRSHEYIVGKKIDYYHNFLAVKLKFNDEGMYLQHYNGKVPEIKLSEYDEVKYKKILFGMGFFNNLDYWMIHNYKANKMQK